MIQFFRKNIEPNKKLRSFETIVLCLLLIASIFTIGSGIVKINSTPKSATFTQTVEMYREFDLEDYDEDSSVCDVTYTSDEGYLIVTYPYEEYIELDIESITAYEYETDKGNKIYLDHASASLEEIQKTYKQVEANSSAGLFNAGIACIILALSVALVLYFSKAFTTYEKSWFVSIMVLASIVAIIFPEESANGVNGIIIMLLYLLDTFCNILCELLISKQSRYNFLVSVVVEILEIAICIVLMYRFATMVTTLFFWLPIDILSFINWSKHKDDKEEELTAVRRLKGYQEVLILIGIAVWTMGVGYLLSGLDIQTDFYNNELLETIIIYIDACASAVGVANGLFIFFRLREQWIAWYVCAILEGIINILSGQYVLLVLKLGYLTNTTYGYIKWSKYIKSHDEKKLTLF